MLRRSSRIVLEVLAASIAGVAILLGLLLWRISGDEPLRVSFLTPYLETALTPPDGQLTVAIEDTVLTWAGWERTLDLRARGVRVIAADGRIVTSVPQISVTLSVRALLRGLVAPTAIEVFGPRLRLRRDSAGRFSVAGIAPPEGDEAVAGSGKVFDALIANLQGAPDPDSPAGYLNRASVVGGRIILEDERLVGIFSERDIMTRVVSRGLAPSTTPVAQVMTPNPVVVDAQSTVEQCLRIMTQAKCRHLPVVTGGKLVGVVSIRDLLQSDISEKSDEIEMMRAFIHYVPPSTPAGPGQ